MCEELRRRMFDISIHALREEGDHGLLDLRRVQIRFLSTPSARRATLCRSHKLRHGKDFYPRPPRGGRRGLRVGFVYQHQFLSTPSARRATAKMT